MKYYNSWINPKIQENRAKKQFFMVNHEEFAIRVGKIQEVNNK